VKLSIIITLFNVEDYIFDLSNSLNANKLTDDFEIIIVNDGSCDESYKLVDLLDNKNVSYYEIANHGVAYARNYGLMHARGMWVTFIDGDDYLSSDYFLKIDYNTSCDVINNKMSLYVEADGSVKAHPLDYKFDSNKVVNIFNEFENFNLSVANLLLRRDIIVDNNIKFKQTISSFEDAIFYIDYLKFSNGDILINKDSIYFYRKRSNNNSTIDQSQLDVNKYVDFIRVVYLELLTSVSINYVQAMVLYDLWNNMLSYTKFDNELEPMRGDLIRLLLELIDDDVINYMKEYLDENYINYIMCLKNADDMMLVHNVKRNNYHVLTTVPLVNEGGFKINESNVIYNEFKKLYLYQITSCKLILVIDNKSYFFKSIKNKLLFR